MIAKNLLVVIQPDNKTVAGLGSSSFACWIRRGSSFIDEEDRYEHPNDCL
jgi:hypothetical protein